MGLNSFWNQVKLIVCIPENNVAKVFGSFCSLFWNWIFSKRSIFKKSILFWLRYETSQIVSDVIHVFFKNDPNFEKCVEKNKKKILLRSCHVLSKSKVGPDNRMKLTSPKTFPNQLNPICWAQTFLWPRITHTGKRSFPPPPIHRVNRVWSNFKMGCKYFPRENFYSTLGSISPPGFRVIRPR